MSKLLESMGLDTPQEREVGALGTIIKAPIKGALKSIPQIGRGVLELGAAPLRAIAEKAVPVMEGFEPERSPTPGTQALTRLEESIEEALPTQEGFISDVGEGLGQVATMIGTGGLAGLAARGAGRLAAGKAAQKATTAAGAALGSDEFTQDLLANTKNAQGTDMALSAGIGALTGLTEAMPLFKALDRFKASRTKSRLGQTVQNTLAGTAEEGLQEAFQQTVQNLTASGIVKYDETRGLFEGTGESAAVGGGVGGILNFLATSLGPGRRKSRLQESAEVAGDIGQKAREQQALVEGEVNPLTGKEFVSVPAGKHFQYLQNVKETMDRLPEDDPRREIMQKRFDERLSALQQEVTPEKGEDGKPVTDPAKADPEVQDILDHFKIEEKPAEPTAEESALQQRIFEEAQAEQTEAAIEEATLTPEEQILQEELSGPAPLTPVQESEPASEPVAESPQTEEEAPLPPLMSEEQAERTREETFEAIDAEQEVQKQAEIDQAFEERGHTLDPETQEALEIREARVREKADKKQADLAKREAKRQKFIGDQATVGQAQEKLHQEALRPVAEAKTQSPALNERNAAINDAKAGFDIDDPFTVRETELSPESEEIKNFSDETAESIEGDTFDEYTKEYPLSYGKPNGRDPDAMLVRGFNRISDQITRNNADLDGMKLALSFEDLPGWVQEVYKKKGYDVESGVLPSAGAVITNSKGQKFIYLNRAKVRGLQQMRGIVMHEVVGHYGMNKTLGKKNYDGMLRKILQTNKHITREAYNLRNRWANINIDPTGKTGKDVEFFDDKGNKVVASESGMMQLTEEWIAEAARKWNIPELKKQMSREEQNYFIKMLKWMRHQLRKVFGVDKITDDDIARMLATSYDVVVKGEDGANLTPDTQVQMAHDVAQVQEIPDAAVSMMDDLYKAPEHKNRNLSQWQQRANRLWERFTDHTYLNGAYGRINVPDHIRMLQQRPRGRIERAMETSTYVFNELQKLPDADSRQIVKMWQEGDTYRENLSKLSKGGRKLLKDPKKLAEKMDELRKTLSDSQEFLFAHGYLDEELGHKKDPTFLHRTYSKYLSDYKGSSKAPSFMNYLRKRTEIDEVSQKELGKLDSADYMIPGFVSTIARDVALLDMYQDMVKVSDANQEYHWTIDPSFVGGQALGKKGGAFRLSQLTNRIDEIKERIAEGVGGRVHNLTEEQIGELSRRLQVLEDTYAEKRADLMPAIKNAMEVSTGRNPEEITDQEAQAFLDENYVFIDGKKHGRRYGAFTGKYIHRELYKDIVEVQNDFDVEGADGITKAMKEGGLIDKATTWWKRSKTVFNPPYYVRNMFGNFYLMDTATSTPTHKMTAKLYQEAKTTLSDPRSAKWYNLAKDYGLYSTTFSASELYQNQDEFKEVIKALNKKDDAKGRLPAALSMMNVKAMKLSEGLAKYNGALEGIFKQTVMRDAVERWEKAHDTKVSDLNEQERDAVYQRAALKANQAIFDYTDVPKAVRTARRSLVPFMTFNYKMLGQMGRTMTSHPGKLLKYYMVPYLLANALMDDEDKEEALRNMPIWMRDKSGVLVMPWRDSDGNMQALDMTYSMPTSTFFDPFVKMYNTVNNNPGMDFSLRDLATDEFGLFGGPAFQAVAAFVSGDDPFTGRELWNDARPAEENLAALSSYMWSFVAPPTLSEYGAVGKTIQQFTSPKDRYGRDIEAFEQSLLRGVGVSLKPLGETSRIKVANTYKFKENNIKKEMRKKLRDPNVRDKASVVKRYHALLRSNKEQWRKAING